MSERRIAWNKLKTKIKNPDLDIDKQELLDEDEDDDDDESDFEEDDLEESSGPLGRKPLMNIDMSDVWIMNTNFNVTITILEMIEAMDGVEYIKPQTRYKCIMSFGKLFDANEIMQKINKNLLEYGIYNKDPGALVKHKLKEKYGDSLKITKMPNGFLRCDELSSV